MRLPSSPTCARLHQLDREPLTLDGVTLDNDLTESNHFVDIFRVSREHGYQSAPGQVEYMYIMHSSGHEHREHSRLGPVCTGTRAPSFWRSPAPLTHLEARCIFLDAERAAAWYQFYRRVQDFNHRRRARIAEFLFGSHDVVINETHQGMVRAHNRANIGCYTFTSESLEPNPVTSSGADSNAESTPGDSPVGDERSLFPLTLSPTLPAFLVEPYPNLKAPAIDALGWRERLDRHGLHERITSQNILPHGGGYRYPQLRAGHCHAARAPQWPAKERSRPTRCTSRTNAHGPS